MRPVNDCPEVYLHRSDPVLFGFAAQCSDVLALRFANIAYGGTYRVDGSCFDAILTTMRHSPGQSSVFGIDEVEIKLAGTAVGNFASCFGEIAQAPGMLFEVFLLTACEDEVSNDKLLETAANGCMSLVLFRVSSERLVTLPLKTPFPPANYGSDIKVLQSEADGDC